MVSKCVLWSPVGAIDHKVEFFHSIDREFQDLNQTICSLIITQKLGSHGEISKATKSGYRFVLALAVDDGILQDCSNSIADELELLQSCSEPLIHSIVLSQLTSSVLFLV